MLHTDRVIVVEGKYDQIRLASVTDALILTTDGFGIFSDREKQRFIKTLAKTKGLLILTDSDSAGFRIRAFLRNITKDADVLNAYIPDVFGVERRKTQPGKEGKIGVEGMDTIRLTEALLRSGAFRETEGAGSPPITMADLYAAGLTGTPEAAERRRAFLARLGLPGRLNAASMLQVLRALMTREAFFEATGTAPPEFSA